MRITYDAKADAVYLYIAETVHMPETRQVDHDIYLDFDEWGRLVGVEVLEASKRLDLNYLLPVAERLDERSLVWYKLRDELLRRKKAGEPVETLIQKIPNWIVEVGDDYVVVRSERGMGKDRTITREDIEKSSTEMLKKKRISGIVFVLRALGGYPE